MVGDIDYFTFPKRLLQNEIESMSDDQIKMNLINLKSNIKLVRTSILSYVRLYKKGLCKFPKAISLLNDIRADKVELKNEVKIL